MKVLEIFYPLDWKNVKHWFNCVFRDKILFVEAPCGHAKSLSDVHSWSVVVNYKYKGRKDFRFNTDDERYATTYGSARQAAQDTYALYRKAMEKQRAKQK